MAKKKKAKKIIRPSIDSFSKLDEIVLLDPETVFMNMDIPVFSDDVDSKFITTDLYKDRVRSGDPSQVVRLDRMIMRVPHIFNTVYFRTSEFTFVIAKDKGNCIRLTSYDYTDTDENIKMLIKMIDCGDCDNSWLWQYETDGREIEVRGLYDKHGRYFTGVLANGKIKLNTKYITFIPILKGFAARRRGDDAEFYRRMQYVRKDPSWRSIDIEALTDSDLDYAEYMTKKVLQADTTMEILRYVYTLHIIANNKKFKESVEVKNKDSKVNTKAYSNARGNSKNNTYTINIGKLSARAKRDRSIRERKESEYKKDSWEVRGHKRTYKDGRTIWIKPKTHKRKEELLGENKNTVGKKYKINILE